MNIHGKMGSIASGTLFRKGSNSIIVNAETQNNKSDSIEKLKIESCVEDFFCIFEDMDSISDVDSIMANTENVSASKEIRSYELEEAFTARDRLSKTGTSPTYLEMVKLLLQRRELIEKNADIDLKEYQKTLDITVSDIQIEGNNADVNVTVLKKWHYSFSPDIESAAKDNFYVNLKKENSEWEIANISGLHNVITDDSLAVMGDAITSSQREQYISSITNKIESKEEILNVREDRNDNEVILYMEPSKLDNTRATSGYNNTAAVSYALTYAINPNPSYTYFSQDCTNFISQCLDAGGIKHHVGTAYTETCWYYTNGTNRSSSWTGTAEFQRYVTSSVSKIDITVSNWDSVVPGDIIQCTSSGTAFHSFIVTGLAYSSYGRSDLLVCAHTANRSNVSLAQYYGSRVKVYYQINGGK